VSAWLRHLACLSCLFLDNPAQAAEGAIGLASFYAAVPASSEKLTAARRSLPFGTIVSVTRLDTGAQVVVRINDRGPFLPGRIIDLSRSAAEKLGIIGMGLARVRVQVVPAPVRAVRTREPRSPPSCDPCGLPEPAE
jgi:rare lipoprotein A (peptidoglycan hydrolase)